MTAKEALKYRHSGGKLYKPVRFDESLRTEHVFITHIPAVAQGGPGDDSGKIVIPSHHYRSKLP